MEQNITADKTIGVIGSGYWGKNLVRNFFSLHALHTVCDENQETLKRMMEDFPGTSGVSSVQRVLEDPAIQGVAIATPAVTHFEFAKRSLLAGKDVYVEKPLCMNEEQGKQLIDLADRQKRILMVGHLLWYHPVVVELKKLVQQGEFGRIQAIYSNRLNLGKLRREENVLWSFAPHDVSVILGILEEMPESVQAQGGYFLHQRIADTTVSLLNFASGVRAHIFVSWLHPFKEQKLVIVGDKKMAVFDDTVPWDKKLTLYPHLIEWQGNLPKAHKAEGEFVEIPEQEPLRSECAHFLECIATRKTPLTDGNEGLRVLKVLKACHRAMEQQQAIKIDWQQRDYYAHPTAVVDQAVKIGKGSKIWHFCHLLSGTRLGERCVVGQNVMIGPDVTVGNNCKIQNNVSLYKGVILEDDVFCGPSMVFTNVTNPRSHVNRKSEFRTTLVKQGASIGANATVICGNTLGRYSFIGAGAVVTKDVKDHALMVGNPARKVGWMCACGEKLNPDLNCDQCQNAYHEVEQGLEVQK